MAVAMAVMAVAMLVEVGKVLLELGFLFLNFNQLVHYIKSAMGLFRCWAV